MRQRVLGTIRSLSSLSLSSAVGPVSIAFFAAHRIGWRPMQERAIFKARSGRVFNFTTQYPQEVRRLYEAGAQVSLWAQWGSDKIMPLPPP